jgi:hypothetical protein
LKLRHLATFALLLFGVSMGCGSDFDPPSQVKTLRVIAAALDKPYAAPGDSVTLSLTYADSAASTPKTELSLVFFSPCENPAGSSYLSCLPGLSIASATTLTSDKSGVVGGVTQPIQLSSDILKNARPQNGVPSSGLAYVFFALCRGTVAPFSGATESDFPFACFDTNGVRRSEADFVVGYTQMDVFADGRRNANPRSAGLTISGDSADARQVVTVAACNQDTTDASGCAPPQKSGCERPTLDVLVDAPGELDGSKGPSGAPLREVLWVDYFVDAGKLSDDQKIVSRADTGLLSSHSVELTPPKEPGTMHVWAVLHDARGGMSVLERTLEVK